MADTPQEDWARGVPSMVQGWKPQIQFQGVAYNFASAYGCKQDAADVAKQLLMSAQAAGYVS